MFETVVVCCSSDEGKRMRSRKVLEGWIWQCNTDPAYLKKGTQFLAQVSKSTAYTSA